MTPRNTILITAMLCCAHIARAQPVTVPAGPARSVTLTLAEYNRLIDLARPPAAPQTPAAAVLSSAVLDVRVDEATARGVFTLGGEVLAERGARVTLLSGGTVLEANADGRPLPLTVNGQAFDAWLSTPGPFAATVEWGTALTHSPGRVMFVLPVPSAGAARATFDIPGEQADVHLSHGSITRRTSSNGRTRIEATLNPAAASKSGVEVWWAMRDSAPIAAARETRTLADVMTLLTIGDTDIRMAALVDLTVLQGEPRTIQVRLPPGYDLTGITGSSLEASEPAGGRVVLTVVDPSARRHQFLVTLERSHRDGSFTIDSGFLGIDGVQRERGEVAIEGVGTLELTSIERNGMHRMDVREVDPVLRDVADLPLLAAYRYQRTGGTSPELDLTVARFPDSSVLAATVDNGFATTLITSQGRALTEVRLRVQNRAQPFLKVALPAGATIMSVEVAGEPAKPAIGTDGTRIPLLRPGFRPSGPYDVAFVYLSAGAPLVRKGNIQMMLPRMDIPVGVMMWEVFAPGDYSLRYVEGNALAQPTVDRALTSRNELERRAGRTGSVDTINTYETPRNQDVAASPGVAADLVHGLIKDSSGAVLPGVTVSLVIGGETRTTTTSGDGTFRFTRVPIGPVTLRASLLGFATVERSFVAGNVGRFVQLELRVGSVAETITVTGAAPIRDVVDGMQMAPLTVMGLQQRVAGVLPIRVDVPRAGSLYYFSRPLVVDNETTITFQYKRR